MLSPELQATLQRAVSDTRKRRHEYLTLDAQAAKHRPILAEYSAGLIDQTTGFALR